MVSDPKTYADIFIDAGADVLTFHVEALENMEEVIKLCKHIRERGVKAGVSLRPKTSVETLLPYLEYMDVVLVMSVEPGLAGSLSWKISWKKYVFYVKKLMNVI